MGHDYGHEQKKKVTSKFQQKHEVKITLEKHTASRAVNKYEFLVGVVVAYLTGNQKGSGSIPCRGKTLFSELALGKCSTFALNCVVGYDYSLSLNFTSVSVSITSKPQQTSQI